MVRPETMSDPTATEPLLKLLQPIAKTVAELDPGGRRDEASAAALAEALQQAHPFEGPAVAAIGAEITRGINEGWLCTRGDASARFSRVAKAGPQTAELSVDVVALEGAALRHTHPRGEVTLAFAADAPGGRFDGNPPGWVVMAAGSTHTPTVDGARMNLLYFLPGGAVEWHTDGA